MTDFDHLHHCISLTFFSLSSPIVVCSSCINFFFFFAISNRFFCSCLNFFFPPFSKVPFQINSEPCSQFAPNIRIQGYDDASHSPASPSRKSGKSNVAGAVRGFCLQVRSRAIQGIKFSLLILHCELLVFQSMNI